MKIGSTFVLLGITCMWGVLMFENIMIKALAAYVGCNFLCLGAGCVFRRPGFWMKRVDGTINPASYVLFAPLMLLNWASFLLAIRLINEDPVHEIAPNLRLGRRLLSDEVSLLLGRQPLAVIDLTSEFPECRLPRTAHYLCVPVMDHTAPTHVQLQAVVQFVSAHIRDNLVYVHCALGHGRSAMAVIAWFLAEDATLTVEQALQRVRATRAGVHLNAAQREALEAFVITWRNRK